LTAVRRLTGKKVLLAVLCVLGVVALVAIGANAFMLLSTKGDSTSDPAKLKHAQAAIVLGALVQPNGQMSGMLADRVSQAVALWRAHKVDRILVSGDHHTWAYDEPDTMREALMRAGVPAHDIFTDHAGFDTWASMVRARKVFGVDSAIVVTQGFHMARALYLGKQAGLHVSGLTADLHGYGYQGKKSDVRELFARVKAVGDTLTHPNVLLGPRIPITGDGRVSWGPQHPPSAQG
jgi:SanA protein